MNLRIAYKAADGSVAIVIAAPIEQLRRVFGEDLTEDEYRAHVYERSVPKDASDVHELPDDWTPPDDRTFREAWDFKDGEHFVNMDKAREIHMERIRQARNARLKVLDVDMLRKLENGLPVNELGAEKQRLRDLPQNLDLTEAKTPDELRKMWPSELLGGGV